MYAHKYPRMWMSVNLIFMEILVLCIEEIYFPFILSCNWFSFPLISRLILSHYQVLLPLFRFHMRLMRLRFQFGAPSGGKS